MWWSGNESNPPGSVMTKSLIHANLRFLEEIASIIG
jgi:hypothetical protein